MPVPFGFIQQLLGSFIGDQTPQRNPLYEGPDPDNPGQWKNGQPPYAVPGFGTKLFNPDVAHYEAAQNNSLLNSRLQSQVGTQVGSERYNQVKGPVAAGTPVDQLDNRVGSILTGDNPTTYNMGSLANTQARMATGLPRIEAEREAVEGLNKTAEEQEYANLKGPQLAGANRADQQSFDPEARQFELWKMNAFSPTFGPEATAAIAESGARQGQAELGQMMTARQKQLMQLTSERMGNEAAAGAINSSFYNPEVLGGYRIYQDEKGNYHIGGQWERTPGLPANLSTARALQEGIPSPNIGRPVNVLTGLPDGMTRLGDKVFDPFAKPPPEKPVAPLKGSSWLNFLQGVGQRMQPSMNAISGLMGGVGQAKPEQEQTKSKEDQERDHENFVQTMRYKFTHNMPITPEEREQLSKEEWDDIMGYKGTPANNVNPLRGVSPGGFIPAK